MTGLNLPEIKSSIAKVKKKTDDTILDFIRKIVIQTDQALVLATPRDKGTASGNWLPSLNDPILTPIENIRGNVGLTFSRTRGVLTGLKLGDTVFLTNNLPYIGKLNDGSSKQAPAGFAEKAAQAAIRSLL